VEEKETLHRFGAGFLIKPNQNQSYARSRNRISKADRADGYFYEDDTDEALNIETKTYENGRQVKRVVLSDKSIAIVRELNGAEMEGVSKAINKKEEGKYLMAVCMFATTINGGKVTMDELEQMRGRITIGFAQPVPQ
jgi:hypothetical protein